MNGNVSCSRKKGTPPMKSAYLVLAILFLLGACTPSPFTPAPVSSAPPTNTPTVTSVVQASATPLSDPTPPLVCDHDTASLVLSTNAKNLKIGDPLKVTATLSNDGCVALGLPQYRLYIQSEETQPIITPAAPEPVVHYLAVSPGQQDSVEFTLTAGASGQATLTVVVSYEVHLGYPGPAYWGGASSEPLVIPVAP